MIKHKGKYIMLAHKLLAGAGKSEYISPISMTYIKKQQYVSFTNGTLTMPTGIESGDIILVYQLAYRGQSGDYPTGTITYGNGFTAVNGQQGNNILSGDSYYTVLGAVSYKIANGTESGTSITGFIHGITGFSNWSHLGLVFVLRPSGNISNISITNLPNQVFTGTYNPPQCDINSSKYLEIVYHLNCGTNSLPTVITTPPDLANSSFTTGGIGIVVMSGGIWVSTTQQTYSFDSSSTNNINIQMAGRLIIT